MSFELHNYHQNKREKKTLKEIINFSFIFSFFLSFPFSYIISNSWCDFAERSYHFFIIASYEYTQYNFFKPLSTAILPVRFSSKVYKNQQ